MRIPRGRIPLLAGGAALVLAIGILVQQKSSPGAEPSPAAERPHVAGKSASAAEARSSNPPRETPAPGIRDLPGLPPPALSPHPTESAEQREWIDRKTSELDDLAWYDDFESLRKILSELRSSHPEIRTSALAATRAFGSREAIPYLEAISRDTADATERQAIRDLIDHLNKPTALEQSDWNAVE